MINSQTIKNAKAGNESAIQEIFSSFKSILQLKTKNYFFYGGNYYVNYCNAIKQIIEL